MAKIIEIEEPRIVNDDEVKQEVSKTSAVVEKADKSIQYVYVNTVDKKEQDTVINIFSNDVNLAKNLSDANPGLSGKRVVIALFFGSNKEAVDYVDKILAANKIDGKVDKKEKSTSEKSNESKEDTVKDKMHMENKESNEKEILSKISAWDWLSISKLFGNHKSAAPVEAKDDMAKDLKDMAKEDNKEDKKEDKMDKDMPTVKDDKKPVEHKKDAPGDKEIKIKETVLKDICKKLEELKKQEEAEGEPEDVKRVDDILKLIEPCMGKSDTKKFPGDIPVDTKKPEEPKPAVPQPAKPIDKKPFPPIPSKANLKCEFEIVKNASGEADLENSKLHIIDLKAQKRILRASLGALVGSNPERLAMANTPEFADKIADAICTNGLTREAVFTAVATYDPSYPTQKKMKTPPLSSHEKETKKAPADSDTEVAPLPKKASAEDNVEKTAETDPIAEIAENVKKDMDILKDKEEDKKEQDKEASADATVNKTADTKEAPVETDKEISGGQAHTPKAFEYTDQNVSGHPKETKKVPVETDKNAASDIELKKLAAENDNLKKELAKSQSSALLDKKITKCQSLIRKMHDKGLLKIEEEYRLAALKEGFNVESARVEAIKKSAESQMKKFLAMDDESLEMFASSVENIEKKASKKNALTTPITVQATSDALNEVEEFNKITETHWS